MTTKSVLITGCSAGGIGSALVVAFQRRGLRVFATARNPSKMSHLEGLPNVTLLTLDVTSMSDISATVEAVKIQTGGTLDYLVNNAGTGVMMPALDVNIEEGKKSFDVNFWGVLAMSQAFVPLLIAAKGTIVNISSGASCISQPFMSMYSASKAALEMLGETMRLEMLPFGVNVVTVVSGAVSTNIHQSSLPFQLPSASRYRSIEAMIAPRAAGQDGFPRAKADDYAEKVVSDVLGGARGKIWRGAMATTTRLFSCLLPAFIADKALIRGTGLDSFPRTKID